MSLFFLGFWLTLVVLRTFLREHLLVVLFRKKANFWIIVEAGGRIGIWASTSWPACGAALTVTSRNVGRLTALPRPQCAAAPAPVCCSPVPSVLQPWPAQGSNLSYLEQRTIPMRRTKALWVLVQRRMLLWDIWKCQAGKSANPRNQSMLFPHKKRKKTWLVK